MAYTALQLITRAYYLSQIVSRQLQIPSGDQITDGLYLLNSDLDYKSTDLRLIPYFSRFTFNTIQGQEDYYIPNLYYMDSLTFNIGTVRYSLIDTSRKEYFSGPRVDDVQSLPYEYRIEREKGGSRIYLYFVPSQVFVMKMSGKFGLTDVTLNTDMSLLYDPFYIEYLRYSLAVKICEEWGATVPDATRAKYMEMQKKLMDVSPQDLKMIKRSYYSGMPALDWQLINIPGWVP